MSRAQRDVQYEFSQRRYDHFESWQDTMKNEFEAFCDEFASKGEPEAERLRERLNEVWDERDEARARLEEEQRRWEQEKATYEKEIATLKEQRDLAKQNSAWRKTTVYNTLTNDLYRARREITDLKNELKAAYYYADLEINKYQHTITSISRAINPNDDETSE